MHLRVDSDAAADFRMQYEQCVDPSRLRENVLLTLLTLALAFGFGTIQRGQFSVCSVGIWEWEHAPLPRSRRVRVRISILRGFAFNYQNIPDAGVWFDLLIVDTSFSFLYFMCLNPEVAN